MPAPALHNRRVGTPSGTVITTSGQSGTLVMESNGAATLNLYASISAITGAGASITFGIAFDSDAGGATFPVGGFGAATTGTALTTTGTDVLAASATRTLTGRGDTRFYRISWTVAGTSPSITVTFYTDN